LDVAFSHLKGAIEEEITLWTREWPPADKVALSEARGATAKAASNYIAIADPMNISVSDNVRRLSECSTPGSAKTAVEKIFDQINAGTMTKAGIKGLFSLDVLDLSEGQRSAVGEFYSDIADILNNLGQGLANAQKKLDIGAMMSQKEILEDDVLSGYGLSANWYVMPEAEFNMMMELGITEREEVEGELEAGRVESSGTKIVAALSDAKYSALYKSESRQESSLRVRFVPVPMPSVVRIPDLIGLPVAAASSTLSGSGVGARFIGEDGMAWTDEKGVVISQSIRGGQVMLAEKVLMVTVTKGTKRKRSAETEPLTLDEAFSKMNEAAGTELLLWTETWPPAEELKEKITTARMTTGKAARRYVRVADPIGAEVSDNVRSLSAMTGKAKAEKAVEEIFASIYEGSLTEEQLRETFVFDAPGAKGTD
jgi:hypothetical protein